MHLEINIDDLPHLKTDLRKSHPDSKASQRIEAAARGCGFKSYAAMRTALEAGPQVVEPYDTVFNDYLGICSKDEKPLRSLSHAVARTAVRRALELESLLTERGFDSVVPQTSREREMTRDQLRAAFKERREEALGDWAMDQFELALIYINMQEYRKTINKDFSSYGLKHRAENLSRNQKLHTHLGNYVSNGMLIAAAMTRGLACKPTFFGSSNAFFNISSKSIRATADGPIMTIREKNQLLAYALADVA